MKSHILPTASQEYLRDPAEVSAAKIKAEKTVKTPKLKKGNVAPTGTLRERILSISLFPNPYNREMIMRYATE